MTREDRALVVGLSAVAGGLLLYFVGIPLLGMVFEDWGRFLIGVVALAAAYCFALGAGVAWIMRGPRAIS